MCARRCRYLPPPHRAHYLRSSIRPSLHLHRVFHFQHREVVIDDNNLRGRTDKPEGTGEGSDEAGQGSLAEETTTPIPNEEGAGGEEWFGSPLFLSSGRTALASATEAAPAMSSETIGSVYHPMTPRTSRVYNVAAFESGQQQDVESDVEVLGWMKGFLNSVAQKEAAEPGAAAATMRPVWPNEGMACNAFDAVDGCDGYLGDEIALAPGSVNGTTRNSDIENDCTSTEVPNESLLLHGYLLKPSAVIIGRSSRREVVCHTDSTPRDSDVEARWERAALRRLDKGIEAYRRQHQEFSTVGPGGLLVPVAHEEKQHSPLTASH